MRSRILLIALIALTASALAAPPPITRLVPSASSALVLEGSSNVKEWRCTGTTLQGGAEIATSLDHINAVIDRIEDGNIGAFMAKPDAAQIPHPSVDLLIPVSSLRCGNRTMERDMSAALRADRFPTILFRLTGLESGIEHDIDAHDYRIRIAGQLTLSGVSRRIDITIRAARIASDRFRIDAEMPLRMTDFGITPPTALFGLVKAKDALTVRFELVLQADAASETTAAKR